MYIACGFSSDRTRVTRPVCPLKGGFFALGDEAVYLTVAARGWELWLFVYDQHSGPVLRYALLKGRSREPLPTRGCVR